MKCTARQNEGGCDRGRLRSAHSTQVAREKFQQNLFCWLERVAYCLEWREEWQSGHAQPRSPVGAGALPESPYGKPSGKEQRPVNGAYLRDLAPFRGRCLVALRL